MKPTRHTAALAAATLLCAASAARAQSLSSSASAAAEAAPPAQVLVLQPIRSGPVLAADVKVTDIDGSTEVLFGAWGGYLHDDTWFFGAAGYWLPDTDEGLEMSYGGVVVGWQAPAMGPLRFGVRGLVGGGWATLPVGGVWPMPYEGRHDGRPGHAWPPPPSDGYYWGWYSDGFFVAEPQVDVVVRLAPWLSLTGGVSYRWTDGDDILDDRLNGVAGSLALRFGVF